MRMMPGMTHGMIFFRKAGVACLIAFRLKVKDRKNANYYDCNAMFSIDPLENIY